MTRSGVGKGKTPSKCYIKPGELSYRSTPSIQTSKIHHILFLNSAASSQVLDFFSEVLFYMWLTRKLHYLILKMTWLLTVRALSSMEDSHPTKTEHRQVILCPLSFSCCQSISFIPVQFEFLLPITPVPSDIAWGDALCHPCGLMDTTSPQLALGEVNLSFLQSFLQSSQL